MAGVLAAACGPTRASETSPAASGASTPGASGTATVKGKLQVVQVLDFHPDHNAFIKKSIQDYAAQRSWQLDLSDLAGFLGSSDIYQKLQAQKSAGQPVDLIFHGLSGRQLALFGLTRDATPTREQDGDAVRPALLHRARESHRGQEVGRPALLRPRGRLLDP